MDHFPGGGSGPRHLVSKTLPKATIETLAEHDEPNGGSCQSPKDIGVPSSDAPCVTGDSKEIGGEQTSNPIVRKLTFTGLTGVG